MNRRSHRWQPVPWPRSLVGISLLLSVSVVTATGIWAFCRPFSIIVLSLHVAFGIWLASATAWHVVNNWHHLRRYLGTWPSLCGVALAICLATAAVLQWPPVATLIHWSRRQVSVAQRPPDSTDRRHPTFRYRVSESYELEIAVQWTADCPRPAPPIAVWLENASAYHIATVYAAEAARHNSALPYWSDKRQRWQNAQRTPQTESEKKRVDAISQATPNRSFDPRDYILRGERRFTVLLEVGIGPSNRSLARGENPATPQSLVYSVEVDNLAPRYYQLLTLLGVPRPADKDGEWQIGYDTSQVNEPLQWLDSVLVTAHRHERTRP